MDEQFNYLWAVNYPTISSLFAMEDSLKINIVSSLIIAHLMFMERINFLHKMIIKY